MANTNPRATCLLCGGPALARGLCVKHYWQARRAGRLPATLRETCAMLERDNAVLRAALAKFGQNPDELFTEEQGG